MRKSFLCALLLAAAATLTAAAASRAFTPGDYDGDRASAGDRCPFVFNPEEAGKTNEVVDRFSADWDHDGLENACDPTPGAPADYHAGYVYLRSSKDGSLINGCAELRITYHFEAGGPPSTTSTYCSAGYMGIGGVCKHNAGRGCPTGTDYEVLSAPAGCSNPHPSSVAVPLDADFTRVSIYFDGPDCGIGIDDRATSTQTMSTTTTTSTTAPPPTTVATQHDALTATRTTVSHTVAIPAGTTTATLTIKWNRPGAKVALKGVRQAGSQLSVTTTKTRTSLVVEVAGLQAGALSYSLAARHVTGSTKITTVVHLH